MKDLYNIGVDRINISIDSLKDDKYKYITCDGDIKNARDGINEVLKYNFKKIKPCLHSSEEINIKNLSINEIRQKMIEAINKKLKEHEKLDARIEVYRKGI